MRRYGCGFGLLSISLVLSLFGTGCEPDCTTNPTHDQCRPAEGGETDRCAEAESWKTTVIASIRDDAARPDLDDQAAMSLLAPLGPSYGGGDDDRCYVTRREEVTAAARDAVKENADTLLPVIMRVCEFPIPDSHDLEKIGAITEAKRAAKEALAMLGDTDSDCT